MASSSCVLLRVGKAPARQAERKETIYMAITISELAELAKQAGMNVKVVPEDDLVVGNWSTDRFRDSDGDAGIAIFVILGEDGRLGQQRRPGCTIHSRCSVPGGE